MARESTDPTDKRERDRLMARYRRELRKRRRALAVRWLDVMRAERDLAASGAELAKRRTEVEAERAASLADARGYRRNPRAHLDTLFWRPWFAPMPSHNRWQIITPADRRARLVVAWLDAGRAWVARVGDVRRVGAYLAAGKDMTDLQGISAPAWTAALAEWEGWWFRPDKGGRPPVGAVVYRPDQILTDLLRAGGLKKPSRGGERDAEGLRQKVQAVDRALKSAARPRIQEKV